MTLGKGIAPFHAKAKLKQTAQAKILISPISIGKRAHQIAQHAYHQTAHFFMSQNDHHSGDAINFDYVSHPLHFYKLRMVVCVIILSFQILPVLINRTTMITITCTGAVVYIYKNISLWL